MTRAERKAGFLLATPPKQFTEWLLPCHGLPLEWMMNASFIWSWETHSRRSSCGCQEGKGYVTQISAGNDKQGFLKKQGILTHGWVHLLLGEWHSCYRPKTAGERKDKRVPGYTAGANLSVLNLIIVKKKEKERRKFMDWQIDCASPVGTQKSEQNPKPFLSL